MTAVVGVSACPQAMWLMLQHDSPQDFVISTGEMHSVRELVEICFQEIGMEIVYVIPSHYIIIIMLYHEVAGVDQQLLADQQLTSR